MPLSLSKGLPEQVHGLFTVAERTDDHTTIPRVPSPQVGTIQTPEPLLVTPRSRSSVIRYPFALISSGGVNCLPFKRVTDGGLRSDGTFVRLPLHDVTMLTEACRRAVLSASA